jgi:hypothetical protein
MILEVMNKVMHEQRSMINITPGLVMHVVT